MILQGDSIKIILFSILCICFIFYLFLGIFIYKKEIKMKVNAIFFSLCISTSLWAIGYAFMLISPNIKVANLWRLVSGLGWCSFSAIWIAFTFSLENKKNTKAITKIKFFLSIISIIFFVSNLMYQPFEVLIKKNYGYVSYVSTSIMGTSFILYCLVTSIAGLIIIFLWGKSSKKNRVKKQAKMILITSSISFCLAVTTDMILPKSGIIIFPVAIITNFIAMGGMWYAINKYKMMSISYEIVSEYIFEAINEPIFILGEDLIVKNCNEATINITGYKYSDLELNSIDSIINFRNFNFDKLMEAGNITNIEVDLHRENKETLVCELSATIVYDEYKDILGIIILLHDVSKRNIIAEIQKEYSLKLEKSNFNLKNEITERLLAEEQIRHFVYYDALTQIFNRKKMLEDINLLVNKKNKEFTILFIDLDKLKSANDNYGHQAGDNILKTVALRLKNIIRSEDTVYRIGGDEFIIILRNSKGIVTAKKIAVAVVEALRDVFIYKDNQIFIGCSIGISIFPEHGIDADILIKKADLVMYEVKRKGGNGYKIYSSKNE